MKKIVPKASIRAIISAAFLALCSFANSGYKVGDKAMDFKLKNVDGKMVSLSDYKEAKGFIVIFTCNHCPYAQAYQDRIIALNAKFAPRGYPVIAINPTDPTMFADDTYANMQQRAKEKNYAFPYLFDEKQLISRSYGATRTPDVFILQKQGMAYIVEYIGAIDDNSDDPSAVKERYVENAVDNLLAGKPVNPSTTKAIGCGIKYAE